MASFRFEYYYRKKSAARTRVADAVSECHLASDCLGSTAVEPRLASTYNSRLALWRRALSPTTWDIGLYTIHTRIHMCIYRYTDIGTYTDSLLPDSVALNTFTVPQDYFCSAWLRVSEFMSIAPAAYTLRAAHELSPKTYAQWCDSYHTYTYLHICNTHTCKYITYYAAYTYNFGGVTTGLFWSLAILRPTLSVNSMQGDMASGYSS